MARYNTSFASKSITGSTTISSPYSGAFVELTGTAPYSITLPDPVLYPGSNQTFYNATLGTITLQTPIGIFTGTGSTLTNTIPVYAGNVVSVTSNGADYVVISEDGSALVATTGSFSGNVTMNGGSATVSITPNIVTINPTGSSNIDNVAIGINSRATGKFTSLEANNQVTFNANITSTGTGNGTIVVTGGIGVSGAINSGGTLTGTLTGVNGISSSFYGGTCAAGEYNFVLSGNNDTGSKLVVFVNGSTRSADGGTNAVTIRNDGGALNLGNASYTTNLYGPTQANNNIQFTGNSGYGINLNGTDTTMHRWYLDTWWTIFKSHANEGWKFRDNSNTDKIIMYGSTGSISAGREVIINGNTGSNIANRLLVGATTPTYTLQDANYRATVYVNSAYPVVCLNNTATTNANHGPTLQFTNSGTGAQFVIGTNGTGTKLDIGYSTATDRNPHNGISSYNGTTAFSMDNAGRIRMPNQPAFHVTAGAGTASGADITYSATIFDNNNNVNLTNGRFTAPVAGVYYFQFHQLANNAAAGEYRTALYVNGAGYGGGRFITQKAASVWWTLIAMGHIKLNAGDYVTVRFESGGGVMYTDANYGSFTGHLVG